MRLRLGDACCYQDRNKPAACAPYAPFGYSCLFAGTAWQYLHGLLLGLGIDIRSQKSHQEQQESGQDRSSPTNNPQQALQQAASLQLKTQASLYLAAVAQRRLSLAKQDLRLAKHLAR